LYSFQQKGSNWEGAIRTNAIIYAPFLANRGVIRDQIFHVSDWLPTFSSLAGFKINTRLDGVDQWRMINHGGESVRNEIVTVDDVFGFGSLIQGKYKLLNGTADGGIYDGFLSSKSAEHSNDSSEYAHDVLNSKVSMTIQSNLTAEKIMKLRKSATVTCGVVAENSCDLIHRPCLFDILKDPCEKNNLAENRPLIYKAMRLRYFERTRFTVPSRFRESDPACDPKYFNNNWNWWQQDS
jgi:arylsulfatase B